MSHPDGARETPDADRALESTAVLLTRVRDGDTAASEKLVARYITPLQRLARRLLPRRGRDLADTDDLVFTTLHSALRRVRQGGFEPRGEGAFLAYLRQILHNAALDEARRLSRNPRRDDLSTDIPDPSPSPLMGAIGRQQLERFEAALARLPERKRHAIILRIEFGYSYEEVAAAAGFPTASAARMQVARSLVQLVELLDER